MTEDTSKPTAIALFQEKKVRRVWHNDHWYFSVIDVVGILSESDRPRKYWDDLKRKLIKEGYVEVSEKIGQLKMEAPDGKLRETDAADTETLLRIIQTIPSVKAEPFKRWLAQVATQRLEEIENPALAVERARLTYEQKGYPSDWIDNRLQSIGIRKKLTNEWQQRGADEGRDYGILTNEISKATFGLTVGEYKDHKGLAPRHELRDNMTDLELIFTMLGEATATRYHKQRDSQGVPELKRDAKDAGNTARKAREVTEGDIGAPVISSENYLQRKKLPGKKKDAQNQLPLPPEETLEES